MRNTKKVKLCAACLAVTMLFTGCGNQIPELTEEESQRIGEFAAITLLKYDSNHRSRLVDIALIEEEKKEAPLEVIEEPVAENKEVADAPIIVEQPQVPEVLGVQSIEECLDLVPGLEIAFTDYEITDSYPTDEATTDYFTLDAASGKKLLVLKFNVANQTGQTQEFDIFGKKAVFRVTVNDSYTRKALTTMLMNDFTTYLGNLEAGANQEMVLLIEIDEEMAGNVSSISLKVKNESKEYTICLI